MRDKAELLRYVHRPPYEELEQYQALFRYVEKHFGSRAAEQFGHGMIETNSPATSQKGH